MTGIRNMTTGAVAVVGSFSVVLTVCGTSWANGTLPEIQAGGGRVTGTSTSNGWVAHSAYGLQLSVPKAWVAAYFRNCPVRDAGTLLIGTPAHYSFCTEIPSDANIVTMQPETTEAVHATHVRRLMVHGLVVISYSTGVIVNWAVPSKSVVLTAKGSESSGVLNTLSIATSRAHAAPGFVTGTEYVVALMRTPVTGPVSVKKLDSPRPDLQTVHAYDGQFSETLAPGTYLMTGQDGDAPCPPVRVIVASGRRTDVPEIDCRGE